MSSTTTSLALDDRHLELRDEVASFLAAYWRSGAADDTVRFRRSAIEAGWLYRWVPREFGGAGVSSDVVSEAVIASEFRRVGAPGELGGMGVRMLVPTLLEHGATFLKERFIEPTLLGQLTWCQGYSEPEAGSDLASVRTKATRRDDGSWRVDGRKIWTSFAAEADYAFVLARSEPESEGRDGLSYLLVDMRQPGIEVTPIRQITGESDFNEVLFEGATAPADWVVGRPGAGWTVATTTLRHERAMIGGADRQAQLYRALLRLLAEVGEIDPALRRRLVELREILEVRRFSMIEQVAGTATDLPMLGLTSKLLQSSFSARVADFVTDLLGPDLIDVGASTSAASRWHGQVLGSMGWAIAGGTSNIQRDILARRGLGLADLVGER